MKTIRSFDFIAAGIDFDILEHPLDGCGGNRLTNYLSYPQNLLLWPPAFSLHNKTLAIRDLFFNPGCQRLITGLHNMKWPKYLSCRFLSSDFLKKRLCLRSPATGMEAVRNFDRIVFIFRICQNLFKRIQNICLCNGFYDNKNTSAT